LFRVIIFDFIGVFSEHNNIYSIFKKITNFKGTTNSLKAYLEQDYNKLLMGKTTELSFFQKLKEVTKSRKKEDSIKKEFLSSFKPQFDHEVFNKVRENFKVALCSDFVKDWWLYLEDKFKIKFDETSFSSELKLKKPAPDFYLSIPSKLRVSTLSCAYVSDEASDINAAKGFGMTTIFIPGKSKEVKEADYTYNSLKELLNVLS